MALTQAIERAGPDSAVRLEIDQLPSVVYAPRTDPIYNCHAYLTKVPVAAIKPFLEAFTEPGDTVVDMFAGSGMTGLAATCTERRALLSDISVLGQHIARGYLVQASPTEVRRVAQRVVAVARQSIDDLYTTRRASDGKEVEFIRTIWSFVYRCPKCERQLTYFEHLNAGGGPPAVCPGCKGPFARRSWPRLNDVPVRVVVDDRSGKQVTQEIQRCDLERIERAQRDPRQALVPSLPISPEREMFGRSGLGRAGITETRQFFSPRNAVALHALWCAICHVADESVRQKLRFAFTACLPRSSRRYQWGPKRPLNAQNQTYYVAPVYFEWNVFDLFERKVRAVLRSDELLFDQAPLFAGDVAERVSYRLASADRLEHIQNESVDYVFTDPPFGSNIFYSDMNLFHEAWLGETTDASHEAVVHTTGPRKKDAAERYERLLRGAFSEAFRILKPARHMSVVFGNSSGSVWALVLRAFRDAGFSDPVHVAILDKGQRSVKGLNSGSEGVVTVDLVITVEKPSDGVARRSGKASKAVGISEILAHATTQLHPEHTRNPSYIYAAAMREAIRRHQRLDDLHYTDVLLGLRQLGFAIDTRTGLLSRPITPKTISHARPERVE